VARRMLEPNSCNEWNVLDWLIDVDWLVGWVVGWLKHVKPWSHFQRLSVDLPCNPIVPCVDGTMKTSSEVPPSCLFQIRTKTKKIADCWWTKQTCKGWLFTSKSCTYGTLKPHFVSFRHISSLKCTGAGFPTWWNISCVNGKWSKNHPKKTWFLTSLSCTIL
jgi:hypothetical protein